MNFFYYLIPSGFDCIATMLSYIGLNFIAPSIYVMIRGGLVIVTAFCSIFFLKRTLRKHQYFGCATVFLGIVIVGASNFIFGTKDEAYSVFNIIQF